MDSCATLEIASKCLKEILVMHTGLVQVLMFLLWDSVGVAGNIWILRCLKSNPLGIWMLCWALSAVNTSQWGWKCVLTSNFNQKIVKQCLGLKRQGKKKIIMFISVCTCSFLFHKHCWCVSCWAAPQRNLSGRQACSWAALKTRACTCSFQCIWGSMHKKIKSGEAQRCFCPPLGN